MECRDEIPIEYSQSELILHLRYLQKEEFIRNATGSKIFIVRI